MSYPVGVAMRELKRPRIHTAMPDTRKVRYWPKADLRFRGFQHF